VTTKNNHVRELFHELDIEEKWIRGGTIETDIPHPGAHQLIKYRAPMGAEDGLSLHSPRVHAMLVARSVPTEVRPFCRKYEMSWQEYLTPR
jgi:hypothetical protein